jgi:IstB-like ATP binding protein
MRKLPATAGEDLLEIVMRRYERASTLLASNRPVEDWGKLLGDTAAAGSMLDRLLHHGHVLKCGPKSWRTRSRDLTLFGPEWSRHGAALPPRIPAPGSMLRSHPCVALSPAQVQTV